MGKGNFPGILWLLPLFFGIAGGIVAALIASLKYQASWWELLAGGFIVNCISIVGLWLLLPTFLWI